MTVIFNIASLHYQEGRYCDCITTLEGSLNSLMNSLSINDNSMQACIFRLLSMSHLQIGSLSTAKQYAEAGIHSDPSSLSEMIKFHVSLAQQAVGTYHYYH